MNESSRFCINISAIVRKMGDSMPIHLFGWYICF